uniref:G/T mismatch-specific thymine DNA glycosylase n=1 Tax=Mola mola TaxID=94237 RepID=A0A3Q3XPP0_MOLML
MPSSSRSPSSSSPVQVPVQPAAPRYVTPAKKKRGRPPKQGEQEEAAADSPRGACYYGNVPYASPQIGINPGLLSAYRGHHYPNPGNHFWKCLFLSGLTDKQLNYLHDQSLPETNGIGFTNMVERTTPGSKDLCSKEIREGGRQLLAKLQKYKPLIAAFNGKGIFCKETFGVKAKNLEFGLQPYKIPQTETVCYLMPSSSPRCAQFPRAQDKVHFYIKLKELRDQMRGQAPSRDVQETDYTFDLQLAKGEAVPSCTIEEESHSFQNITFSTSGTDLLLI